CASELPCATVPGQISGLNGVIAASAARGTSRYFHSLALKSDGTVWAWGDNLYGQLGFTTTMSCGLFMRPCSTVPGLVVGLNGVAAVAAGGGGFSLALKSDGTVWTWGATLTTPTRISGVEGVVAVSAGESYSLALKS